MKKLLMTFVAFAMIVPCLAQKPGLVKDEDGYTNIRKGPGTKYDIVGKVKDGGYILYSGGSNDQWYKVYKQDGTFRGYMARNKIMKTASPSF